jgi:hypothetical protein
MMIGKIIFFSFFVLIVVNSIHFYSYPSEQINNTKTTFLKITKVHGIVRSVNYLDDRLLFNNQNLFEPNLSTISTLDNIYGK